MRQAGFAEGEAMRWVDPSQFTECLVGSAREDRMNGICASRPKPIEVKADRVFIGTSLIAVSRLLVCATFGERGIINAERLSEFDFRSTPSRRRNCSFQAKNIPERQE